MKKSAFQLWGNPAAGKRSALLIIALAPLISCSKIGAAPKNSSPAVAAVEFGDPARGYEIAQGQCASCHAVEEGQLQSPRAAAPSFEAIAHRSDMTRMSLRALMSTPHQNMPDFIIAPQSIDDLYAYLSTLKPPG